MILFWLIAALLSGGATVLILARAAGRREAAADPSLEVYRRQLTEIDDLAERGLLGHEEQRSAHAEAGRRLLSAAEQAPETPAPPNPAGRRMALIAAVLAPLLALGGYLALGSPGTPDQPFAARLKAWRAEDPSRLNLPELAAVLQSIAAERPTDPQPLQYLARVQGAEGDLNAAARTLERATALAPRNAEAWGALGEVLTEQGQGEVTSDARTAFERAQALDPAEPAARYYLARADIAAGDVKGGLARWRELLAALPPSDPRRAALQAEIAAVERAGRLPAAGAQAAASAPAERGQEAAFIQSMVDRLADRLKTQPDDPAGWARLIRAYGVLGQTAKRDAAIAQARTLFKDRPADLKTALAADGPAPPL